MFVIDFSFPQIKTMRQDQKNTHKGNWTNILLSQMVRFLELRISVNKCVIDTFDWEKKMPFGFALRKCENSIIFIIYCYSS